MLGSGSTSSVRSYRAVKGRRAASTLIELLVVISIIGLLISVLLPSLKRSMDLASATVCQYHLRELGRAIFMYRGDNDGWLPVAGDPAATGGGGATSGGGVAAAGGADIAQDDEEEGENNAWFAPLFTRYLQDPAILACPDDPYRFRMDEARGNIRDPAVADFTSYGLNSFILTAGGGKMADLDRHQPDRAAETILLCDLGPDTIRYNKKRYVRGGPTRNGGMTMWDDGFDPITGSAARPWVTTRHSHGINVLTVGNSVRHISTEAILRSPILPFYGNCAAGGCPLCKLRRHHYSFAQHRLYWWTGNLPRE